MRRVRVVLLGLLAAVVLLLITGAVLATTVARRPFPQAEGRISLPALTAEVTVLRDALGVPHIYAENEADLFFAQGYVHAQDRFWQMEFWRHIGQGRLAEIAGEPLVSSDRFIRTMGWNRIAADTLAFYERESPEIMAVLEAYSAGVNAYIESHPDRLSINRTILSATGEPWEIEPWTALDTVGWSVVMSDDLSGNWRDELQRARLLQAVDERAVNELLPPYPDDRPVVVPTDRLDLQSRGPVDPTRAAVDWSRVGTTLAVTPLPPGFSIGGGAFAGSNNWVVGGMHSETGAPLLANDPHLGVQMPSIWYEVALHAPGFDVTGFSFAGVPGVVVGHNDRIAWGVTNVGPDVQDLYIERLNPDNPMQYEFMGEWRDLTRHEEVIRVNGGEDVILEVLETHHGPIVTELVDGMTEPLALQWSASARPSRLLLSLLGLNRARNYEEFREALRFWDVPAQNFVYADVEGNIAYQMPGLIPIRGGGADGLTPVPGWSGEYEWEDWIPYEELPALLNPPEGFIVTANHAVVDEAYPYLIDRMWADGDRGQRIVEMIEAEIAGDGTLSREDMARIQFDSKDLLAAELQPLIAALRSDDERLQAVIDRLADWDLQMRRDSVAAALWAIFDRELVREAVEDELGTRLDDYFGNSRDQRLFLRNLAADPDAAWWDDQRTSVVEQPDEIMLRALAATIDWFDEELAGDMDDWEWGKIHTVTFRSNPLGQSGIGPVEGIVNRGPYPADGSFSTVNANSWGWGEPAAVTGHVSMRMIVDMADFDRSQTVIPTGQSGHPYHPHYDDMIPLWLDGRYHPMLWSRDAVEAAATQRLVLSP